MISIRHIIYGFFALAIITLCFAAAPAQSTDQNFPTAVTTNEIDGIIKVRDIGDPRLTSYFYTFDGGQGDVFINVVTKNFTGDIDVFTVDGLRPLTKMVIYADGGGNETGRIVYMRKPERLILRVEGRSPNDDPATFRIKFAGSFIALASGKPQDAPTIRGSEVVAESGVRVNSVGTIVEVLPKSQPSPKATPESKETVAIAKNKKPEPEKKPSQSAPESKKETVVTAKVPDKKPPPATPPPTSPPAKEVAKTKTTPKPENKPHKKSEVPEVKTVFKKTPKPKETVVADKKETQPKKSSPSEKAQPDPMANIRLIISMKDGKVIERPMTEVKKFSVDNGALVVVTKDGNTTKYSILDVAKVTME